MNNFRSIYSPEDIAAGVAVVIKAAQEKFPGVKIILASILSSHRAQNKMMAVNKIIRTFADGRSICFLDLVPLFAKTGRTWKGLDRDRLHLTTEGYEMWADALSPLLGQLLPGRKW